MDLHKLFRVFNPTVSGYLLDFQDYLRDQRARLALNPIIEPTAAYQYRAVKKEMFETHVHICIRSAAEYVLTESVNSFSGP